MDPQGLRIPVTCAHVETVPILLRNAAPLLRT